MGFAPFGRREADRKHAFTAAYIAADVVFGSSAAARVLAAIVARDTVATAIRAVLEHDAAAASAALKLNILVHLPSATAALASSVSSRV